MEVILGIVIAVLSVVVVYQYNREASLKEVIAKAQLTISEKKYKALQEKKDVSGQELQTAKTKFIQDRAKYNDYVNERKSNDS